MKLQVWKKTPRRGTASEVCGVSSLMIVKKIQMAKETEIWRPTFSHVSGLTVKPRMTRIMVSRTGAIRLKE